MSTTPPALVEAFTGPHVRPFMATFLDYPAGPVRLTSLPRGNPLVIAGETWLATGELGQMSAIESGTELRSYGFALTLSGIPGNWGAYLRAQDVLGRRVKVYLGAVNERHEVLGIKCIKVGRMDAQDVATGDTTTVNLTCEDVMVDWERPRVRRMTDVDHRTRHPSDGFFKYMAAMENLQLREAL